MALTKRTLGRTGLEVTDLAYGAMEVRGSRIWGGRPVTEGQAETILNAVLDSGINFIDTANDYGRSEEFIGKYLSRRRDQYYLATKCGCTVEQVEQGDLVAVLQEMKQQGKVRWIGCSSTSPHIETYIQWGVFDVFQIPYSALERQHEDAITAAGQAGAGTIICGGVARGEPGV